MQYHNPSNATPLKMGTMKQRSACSMSRPLRRLQRPLPVRSVQQLERRPVPVPVLELVQEQELVVAPVVAVAAVVAAIRFLSYSWSRAFP